MTNKAPDKPVKMVAVNGLEVQIGDVWQFDSPDPVFLLVISGFPAGFPGSANKEYQFECLVLSDTPKKNTYAFDCEADCYTLMSRLDPVSKTTRLLLAGDKK